LKTEQEIKIQTKTSISKQTIEKKDVRDIKELNQMESLILAQDERWRHA
jgi:hypothetical protein